MFEILVAQFLISIKIIDDFIIFKGVKVRNYMSHLFLNYSELVASYICFAIKLAISGGKKVRRT